MSRMSLCERLARCASTPLYSQPVLVEAGVDAGDVVAARDERRREEAAEVALGSGDEYAHGGLGQVSVDGGRFGTSESDAGEEFVGFEQFGGAVHRVELEAGSPGDVEQRRGPSERLSTQSRRHLGERASIVAADRPVQPAPTELRLARIGTRLRVRAIALEDVTIAHQLRERVGQLRRRRRSRGRRPTCGTRGSSPCGLRPKHPTGRSKPGEQYWRSS